MLLAPLLKFYLLFEPDTSVYLSDFINQTKERKSAVEDILCLKVEMFIFLIHYICYLSRLNYGGGSAHVMVCWLL